MYSKHKKFVKWAKNSNIPSTQTYLDYIKGIKQKDNDVLRRINIDLVKFLKYMYAFDGGGYIYRKTRDLYGLINISARNYENEDIAETYDMRSEIYGSRRDYENDGP